MANTGGRALCEGTTLENCDVEYLLKLETARSATPADDVEEPNNLVNYD